MTKLKDWPDQERPREKLLSQGASALSDAELLAIFLRTGCRGLDVVTLARQLLTEFGSLHTLFAASEFEFCEKRGLGQAKYAQLQAVLEMSCRYLQEPIRKGQALTSAAQTKTFLSAKMHHLPYEVFAALLLDTQHRVICFHEFFFGSIDSATVHPRIIAQKVLSANAAAIILVHNHPSGDPTASISDKKITEKIVSTMQLIDVRVLDHFIIGHEKCTSFAENGWI
ncbi:RadC family protein [Psychromonas antarctica]|jgi:DNA repair protein RadC|uniref:RadC family protein n=1 Tax=Psychromonas antarctica TaxID=67573 RepID=UPI001EE88397|nr:DNA repair protein RadC [Psychromonas antarctica]MCG6201476.1 DNA repair protein RadC [Psychromonas antarctica]